MEGCSSADLTAFQALFSVHAEEAEHARDLAESKDGEVIVSGLEGDDEDDDDGE